MILSRGTELAVEEESLAPTSADALRPLAETLEDAERAHIQKALEASGWRVSGKDGAAERLGLKPSTLQFRIKKLGLTRPAERLGAGSEAPAWEPATARPLLPPRAQFLGSIPKIL